MNTVRRVAIGQPAADGATPKCGRGDVERAATAESSVGEHALEPPAETSSAGRVDLLGSTCWRWRVAWPFPAGIAPDSSVVARPFQSRHAPFALLLRGSPKGARSQPPPRARELAGPTPPTHQAFRRRSPAKTEGAAREEFVPAPVVAGGARGAREPCLRRGRRGVSAGQFPAPRCRSLSAASRAAALRGVTRGSGL